MKPSQTPWMRSSWLLLLLLSVHGTGMAQASKEDSARQMLERMAASMQQMSYQGTFVYMRGNSVETMRITHVVDEAGVRERLYSVNGPQREVIRDREGVRCVLGDKQSVMRDALVNGSIYPEISLASSNGEASYRFSIGNRARLAGHHARRVSIQPADGYRYGYEFWLEENSGLLLKWVLYDQQRKPLARLMFTELVLGDDIRESELKSNTPSDQFTHLESTIPASPQLTRANPHWTPSQLPPGFRLAAHNQQLNDGQSVYEHLVYSDGLASVSVYVEDSQGSEGNLQGISRIGTANVFSRNLGNKQVTVIGEVPAATVRLIGNAVHLAAAD